MPDSYVSVQRDYDGTPMISDVLPDEFYLTMAKALNEKGEGCIQYTQASARIDDPERGPRYDFDFNVRLAEESGRPVQKADGYHWIMVNGQVTFADGKCTNAIPGKLLRHGRAS